MIMNFNNLINKAKHLFIKTKNLIKTVRDYPHSGKYFALACVLTIFFTAITFPYDYLIKKKLYDSEGKFFRSVSMQRLDFNILGESYIDGLELVLAAGEELSVKNIILNPSINPYRLFISHRILADFQFDAVKYHSGETDIIMNINGNIDVVMDRVKNIPGSGEVKLILGDARLKMKEISIPGPVGPMPLKLDSVNVQNGLAEVDIVNGVARIKNFKLTGTDINCSVTGSIELAEKTSNSKLDLMINIDPESLILEQYRELVSAVTGNGPLVLAVKGTLLRPDIKIAGAEKTE